MGRKLTYPETTFMCTDCKINQITLKGNRAKYYADRGGWRCTPCGHIVRVQNTSPEAKARSLAAAAEGRKRISPEKLSEIGRIRRSKVKMSGKEMRARQQESIKSDPVKYEEYCNKRRQIALDFHANMTTEEKNVHYSKVLKNVGISKAENDFFNDLMKVGIFFERNQAINGFIVDGLNKDVKVIVEFYGDTFHCNPKKYTDPEQYCSWIKRTVKEQWKRDQRRLACFYKLGYTVVIIWQSDWTSNPQKELERIQNALHIS